MSVSTLVIFAEDDHEDWGLIKDALEECNQDEIRWERCLDGVELMARLKDSQQRKPDMIMLDLKMPKMDGAEALQEIRMTPELQHIPIIILTTSKLEADIFQSYHKGASSYVVKPVTYETIKSVLHDIRYYWTKVARIPLNSVFESGFVK